MSSRGVFDKTVLKVERDFHCVKPTGKSVERKSETPLGVSLFEDDLRGVFRLTGPYSRARPRFDALVV